MDTKTFPNMHLKLKKILLNKWFFAIIIIKIICGTLFGSDLLVKGFAPFINYFVNSGFENPYNYFLSIGDLKSFPYSSMMLWILALPRALLFFLFDSDKVGFLNLLITRIPILLADVSIYIILCKWLETKEKEVLIFYFASPILLYINYIHGQLDVIPTVALFLSLFYLFQSRYFLSFFILGLGLAIKSHLLAVLPLFIVYLLINKRSPFEVCKLTLITIGIYFFITLPYLFSPGYIKIVLESTEQYKLFLLNFPYSFENLKFLIAPGAYFILFCRFASYKKINQDMFILILGLIFSVLVTLVVPQPGWFYWSIPFLAYFYIKRAEAPIINFLLLNILYILYFIFSKNSDFLESFQLISPSLASLNSLYVFVDKLGINAELFSNLLFTFLEGAMLMNVLWCYKAGIKSNFEYKIQYKPVLIGIGGDSGAGKSTFGESLEKLFGKNNTLCVNGDDVHKWPRGHENWEVFTHLNPKSNNLHKELQNAIALKDGRFIERVVYDHDTGEFTDLVKMEPNKFILFVGLHTYYIKKMRDIFDIKIFIDTDESLRQHWKILRDMQSRGYSKEKVLKQMNKREEDANKYIKPQKNRADIVFTYLPLEKIKDLGSAKEKIDIKLRIYFDNSIFVEPLVNDLSKIKTLIVNCWSEDDLENDCMELIGSISKTELNIIAYNLVPNFKELIYSSLIDWEASYRGLSQLFVLYYFSEISKYKSNIHSSK